MARARNIKPGFYKNEDLAECSIWARFIFPGLWMLADREGRLEDRPKRIKGELLPFDSQDVEPLLRELAEKIDAKGVPFIVRYQTGGVRYIQISKFLDHQNPHYSEKESVINPPPFQEIAPDIVPENSGNLPLFKEGQNGLIPDSLNPYSLNPDKCEVGQKPPDTSAVALNGRRAEALQVLEFLNQNTGRNYRPVDANMRLIAARLKEGATVTQCREVVAKKTREWQNDATMAQFLRPATLFNATKFAQYVGELGQQPKPRRAVV